MKLKSFILSLLCLLTASASAVKATDETEPLSVLEIAVPNTDHDPDVTESPATLFTYIELSQQPIISCHHQLMTIIWLDAEKDYQELQLPEGVGMRLIRPSEMPNAIHATREHAGSVVFDMKEPDIVRVCGLKQGMRVTAFSTGGQSVKTAVANASGETTLSLKGLARGIYVISAGERETFKIVKQ